MSKLDNFIFFDKQSTGREILKELIQTCGLDSIVKGIEEYCLLNDNPFETQTFIIDEPYSLVFKDGALIVIKPIK
jgi:hypothetical protein